MLLGLAPCLSSPVALLESLTMAQKRILLVEDEVDMAELVSMRLTRDQYAVEVVHDGREAVSRAKMSQPDLVLLDIMLPGLNGVEVLRELKNDPRSAHIPVIMLTAKGEDSDVVVGLQLGADDYVAKPFSMSVLLARIAAALRRNEAAPQDRSILTAGGIQVNQETHQVQVHGEPISLTLTEFRLLAAIISARGRVLTRNQLIDHAMGMDAVVTDRTIDVHLTALRRKLGSARKYIQTVRGVGYRLATEHDDAS